MTRIVVRTDESPPRRTEDGNPMVGVMWIVGLLVGFVWIVGGFSLILAAWHWSPGWTLFALALYVAKKVGTA